MESWAFSLLREGMQNEWMCSIERANETSSKFGLTLSKQDILTLAERQREALAATGRVDFGGGFCRS